MYTEQDRQQLLDQLQTTLEKLPQIEGLLLMGSGASGFADLYSDIDMMAGCFRTEDLAAVTDELDRFFTSRGICHLEPRAWSPTVLGLSAYFPNGLSVDLSYMPTPELPILAPGCRILFSKSDAFTQAAASPAPRPRELPTPYAFIRELRYVQIDLLRGNLIHADLALSHARQLLLTTEAAMEGQKLHQFKAYHTLDPHFLAQLELTYPTARTTAAYRDALAALLSLYQTTRTRWGLAPADASLLQLIHCFD